MKIKQTPRNKTIMKKIHEIFKNLLKKRVNQKREKIDFDEAYYLQTYPDVANANIDPHFHYVHYGRAEGRHGVAPIRQQETLNDENISDALRLPYYSSFSKLNVFLIYNTNKTRISLITDSINKGSLYGGVGTAIILASLMANEKNSPLRIITRTEKAIQDNLEKMLNIYGIQLKHEPEFVFASNTKNNAIDILPDELFITTSWWTTLSTMQSVPINSIIYLLQEDERMFYPYGDDHLRCTNILKNKQIKFFINTQLLYNYFISEGFTNIAENGTWFEPAFPKQIYYRREKYNANKKILMFYARPDHARNLFYFGIELIEKAIRLGIINLSIWNIVLVGKNIPDFYFFNQYKPHTLENLGWSEYAELIGKVDLGLSLMYTPHPSYPPLDLAASGAVVVTNTFANKEALHLYSPNIISASLEHDALLEALEKGIRLASNKEKRENNHAANTLLSDWSQSFNLLFKEMIGDEA